jgi:hypothetical protein
MVGWSGRAPALPVVQAGEGAPKTKEHARSEKHSSEVAVIGIDIGKNSFNLVGQDRCGALVLWQNWSRGQVETRVTNLPPSARRGRAEKADKSSIGPSQISVQRNHFSSCRRR